MKIEIKCLDCGAINFDESEIPYIDSNLPSFEWEELEWSCPSCGSSLVWRLVSGRKGVLVFQRGQVWDLCPETGTHITLEKCRGCGHGRVMNVEEDKEKGLTSFEVECGKSEAKSE